MELRNLITFIHAAELGSFTKAAEELGYSQSTISFGSSSWAVCSSSGSITQSLCRAGA